MKKYRSWIVLLALVLVCAVGVWITLKATADYPGLGSAASYPVDQVDGFVLTIEFALGGGEGSALEGSIVQKYDYYGTRLEAGIYRLVLEMQAKDGTPHYLAQEFNIQ